MKARQVAALVVLVVVLGAIAGIALLNVRDSDEPELAAPPERGPFPPGTFIAAPGPEANCGEYTWVPIHEDAPDPFPAEHACLRAALIAGSPAVLVQHAGTVEGDPIREQFRVTGVNRLEATHDSTRDQFGGQSVTTVVCQGFEIDHGYLSATECDYSGVEDP